MHSIWPIPPDDAGRRVVDDAELENVYAYPDHLDRPWIQANFVSSADGAVSVEGRSESLSHSADKRIFALGRALADVILVGAGTVLAEQYRGVQPQQERIERRRRLGLSDIPQIAVVSGRCSIPPDAPLLTNTVVPPIVFTSHAAPSERTNALIDAGAEVVVAGDGQVHLGSMMSELDRRGLRRVNCEGGPNLFASMIAEDLVDQLCLTVAPLLAGAGADRIVAGAISDAPRRLTLASALCEDDFLMLRYRRIPADNREQ